MNWQSAFGATVRLTTLALLVTVLSGCEVIEGLLKLGFWTGVIVVVAILFLIAMVARLFRRGTTGPTEGP